MVMTRELTATFLTQKVDAYNRTVLLFTISDESMSQLNDITAKTRKLINLPEDQQLFTGWFVSTTVDRDSAGELAALFDEGKNLFKITKNTVQCMPELTHNTSYALVFDLKYYCMNKKHGLSTCLKSISQ
jgi:hypothetical protein